MAASLHAHAIWRVLSHSLGVAQPVGGIVV